MSELILLPKVHENIRKKMNASYTYVASREYYDKETSAENLPLSRAAQLTWMIASPLILILGTFGNGMSIAVHHRLSTKRRSTVSIYLIALAVMDLMSLYSGLLVLWLNNVFNHDIAAKSDFACKTLIWFIYTSGAMSAWLIVAVTVQRAISVVWPHRVNSLISQKRSLAVVACLTSSLMFIHVHILYGWGIVSSNISDDAIPPQCCIVTQDYLNFFDRIWSWVDLLVFSLIPFAILLASNTALLKTVVTSVREARHRLSVGDKQQLNARQRTASSVTLTLTLLSFTFVTLTGPVCVYLLIKPYVFRDVSVNHENEAVRRMVFALINLLWYTNSAINFYLYCLSGRKFRAELKALLVQVKCTAQKH